jgi:hypothetical protein
MSYREPTTGRRDDANEPMNGARATRTDLSDRVEVERATYRDPGTEVAHERFGGMHVGAQLVGMLTALALTLLLAGLIGAIVGGVAFETGVDESVNATATEISIGSVIGGLIVLAIAFLVGGWAAGRMSRYDGGRNGLMTAVWFLVLGAILGALGVWAGAEYNVAQRVDLLPDWFGTWFARDDITTGAIVSAIAGIAVMLGAGFFGGKLGERFHRRADDVIAAHRGGGIATDRRVVEREVRR